MIAKRVQAKHLGAVPIDLSSLNHYTTTRILQLGHNVSDHQGINIHQVQTDFGSMHLCVYPVDDLVIAQRRLSLRQKHPHLFPVLYEHILIQSSIGYTLLLLYELSFRVKGPKIQKCIIELTQSLCRLNEADLQVQQPLHHIYQSALSQQYYLDFLAVGLRKLDEKQAVSKYLKSLAAQDQVEIASRVYLLEDQVYRWKVHPKELMELSEITWMTWVSFSILMNLPFIRTQEVLYRHGKTMPLKKAKVEDLAGPVHMEGWERPAMFKSGKCIEQYQEYSPEILRQRYFQPQKTYRVSKTNNVTITKQDNSINKNESFAIIEDSVEKIECVEFFIVYMKYFQLTIEKVYYRKNLNQLELTLAKGRYAVIRFPTGYLLRQEELAIVLGRSTLSECTLSLPGSQVSDKLLILLSNLDKTKDLKKIDFSYCQHFTEFGLTSLFESNLCQNIIELNLSGTSAGQSTIDAVKALPGLKSLSINNCRKLAEENSKAVSFRDTGLQVLEAINTQVLPDLNSKLRILKLTIQFPIEQLRILSKMPLEQLRLRLIEHRKQQIMSFVNSIYSISSYSREFCDGAPGKHLKSVDFSDSQIRYKLIRSILQIKNLTEVRLNGCTRLGDQFDHLGADVELLELKEAVVSSRNLKTMIERIVFIRYLDLRGSSLDRRDITDVIQGIGKQLNEVLVDQQQYSSQLLVLVNKPKGSSINKLTVKIHSSLNQKFLSMVYNVSKGNKLVNFDCDQSEELRLAKRIASFLGIRDKVAFRVRYQQLSKILTKPTVSSDPLQLRLSSCKDLTSYSHKICTLAGLGQPLLHLNLNSNRSLSIGCIRVLHQYASEFVRSIDFRNCLFSFDEVALMVCEWPNVINVNDGEFTIKWTQKMFPVLCQKMLRFFMRLHKLTSLVLEVRKVREVQLLFSVLYYVVNHHKPSLTVFKLTLYKYAHHLLRINMELSKDDCTEFWDAILTTITLRSLSIEALDCTNFERHHYRHLSNINRLNLLGLTLRLPPKMPFYPRLTSLSALRLFVNEYSFPQLGEQFVNDAYLAEVVKPCEGLEYLELEFNSCNNVTTLERFSGQLKNLRRLKTLSLSLQYCPLKHSVLTMLLDSIKELRYINRISINISFTHEVSEDITVPLINIGQALNLPYIEIVGFNVFRRGSLQFELEMQQNNIRVVY